MMVRCGDVPVWSTQQRSVRGMLLATREDGRVTDEQTAQNAVVVLCCADAGERQHDVLTKVFLFFSFSCFYIM